MGAFKDIGGQKFGRLTALYRLHNYHKKGVYWLCACECGNITIVHAGHLPNEHTKSCGCLNREPTKGNTKHGKTNIRLFHIWVTMKQRCYNKRHKHYKDYGARGIAVCDEWKDDFQAFYDWSMNNGYDDSLTIDRIDVNGNYEPSNCRWVDIITQNNNKRNNIYLTYNGKTQTIKEWSKELNANVKTLYTRKFKNWSVEDILFGRDIHE